MLSEFLTTDKYKSYLQERNIRIVDRDPTVTIFDLNDPNQIEALELSLINLATNNPLCLNQFKRGIFKRRDISDIWLEAIERRIAIDRLDFWLEDAVKSGVLEPEQSKEVVGNIAFFDDGYAEGAFVRIPPKDIFLKLKQSRDACLFSDEEYQSFRDKTYYIAGLNVGGAIWMALAMAGVDRMRGCDGGLMKGHSMNRSPISDVARVGESQAYHWLRVAQRMNPYGDYYTYPKNLAESDSEETIGIDTFLENGSEKGIVIDAMDSMEAKHLLRIRSNKVVEMGTDLGSRIVSQTWEPGSPLYGGRLTLELEDKLREGTLSIAEKTQVAIAMIGPHVVSQEYLLAAQTAQQKGFTFWPQPAEAVLMNAGFSLFKLKALAAGWDLKKDVFIDAAEILRNK